MELGAIIIGNESTQMIPNEILTGGPQSYRRPKKFFQEDKISGGVRLRVIFHARISGQPRLSNARDGL
jgi:hypothetical protein